MSMTTCVECGKEVSDQANACPHCGIQLVDGFLNKTKEQVSKIAEKAQLSKKLDVAKGISNSLIAKKERFKEKFGQNPAADNGDTVDERITNEDSRPAVSKEVIRYYAIAMSIVLLLSPIFGGIGAFVSATCLASGIGALFFGLRWYGATLAVVYFVSVLEVLIILQLAGLDSFSALSLGILAVTTATVYFLSKPGSYFIAWGIASGIQVAIALTLGLSGPVLGLIVLITSTGLVWYGRKHIKAIIMGSYGGGLVFVGAAGIFLASESNIVWASGHIGVLTFFNLAFIVAGIAFQYQYIMPKKIPAEN